MRKLLTVIAVLAASYIPISKAVAQDLPKQTIRQLNDLNHKFIECSMFYHVTAFCVGKPSNQIERKIIKIYQRFSEEMFRSAAISGLTIRLRPEVFADRANLATDSILVDTERSCSNWDKIAVKYFDMCDNLLESIHPKR